MKYAILLSTIFLLCFGACIKDRSGTIATTIIPPNAQMLADYNFKPGSYWIFKDSVTGHTDSAYVSSVSSYLTYESCVLIQNMPEHQADVITITVNNDNNNDSENWTITLLDTNCNISCLLYTDSAYTFTGYRLFSYPIQIGQVKQPMGCVLYADSGYVTTIYDNYTLNNASYSNTAAIYETEYASLYNNYYDWFYMNSQAGFVKVVLNHPNLGVNRVLELLRYHLVK